MLDGAVALAPGMRDALAEQIEASQWLVDGGAQSLRAQLARASEWDANDALPRAPLLCHDGMGMSGPAHDILIQANAQSHPVLFTGHMPINSPGQRMHAAGRAEWIRLPTHPTLHENVAMAAACKARIVLGHSCEPAALLRLAQSMPALRTDAATGATLET
jgi:hypothetical protein